MQANPADQAFPAPPGEVVLTQGVPARVGDQLLALGDAVAGADGRRRVDVTLGNDGGEAPWQSRVVLRAGEVFPAHGGFLRLQTLDADARARATATIAQAVDTGGIAAPPATDRVLVQGGRVRFSGRWLALVAVEGDTAVVEYWQATQARSRLSDDQVTRQRVRAGETLDLGADSAALPVTRVQAGAGEVLGFVAFEPAPAAAASAL